MSTSIRFSDIRSAAYFLSQIFWGGGYKSLESRSEEAYNSRFQLSEVKESKSEATYEFLYLWK